MIATSDFTVFRFFRRNLQYSDCTCTAATTYGEDCGTSTFIIKIGDCCTATYTGNHETKPQYKKRCKRKNKRKNKIIDFERSIRDPQPKPKARIINNRINKQIIKPKQPKQFRIRSTL